MNYLFLDGNNLAVRCTFANKDLKDGNGVPTGLHFGFFRGLISLKTMFADHQFVVCWDGKSKRRMALSIENVEKKIIKSAYKSNRDENRTKPEFVSLFQQLPMLKEAIAFAGIPQVHFQDYEADDVIASYCKKLREDNKIVVSTTDHDYYQILHNSVSLWDGLHFRAITKVDFESQYGIKPAQYVDVGALMGDAGDNIIGIPSWGDKTALEEIKKHGTYKAVLDYYVKEYGHLEQSFPKIESMLDLESLRLQETKSGKKKYNDVYYGMPFSGVALAIEQGKIKPIPQKALSILMYQERLDVAYSLKKVDDEIADLPDIKHMDVQLDKLQQYFDRYSIKSLKGDVNIFSDKPVVKEVFVEEPIKDESTLFF